MLHPARNEYAYSLAVMMTKGFWLQIWWTGLLNTHSAMWLIFLFAQTTNFHV